MDEHAQSRKAARALRTASKPGGHCPLKKSQKSEFHPKSGVIQVQPRGRPFKSRPPSFTWPNSGVGRPHKAKRTTFGRLGGETGPKPHENSEGIEGLGLPKLLSSPDSSSKTVG